MQPSDRNFNVSLPGSCIYYASWQTPTPSFPQGDVYRAQEQRGGIRRPKPKGWKEPLPYTFMRRAYKRGDGELYRTWTHKTTPGLTYHDYFRGSVGAGQGSPVDSLNAMAGVISEGGGKDLDYLAEEVYRACYLKARQSTLNIGVAYAEAGKTAGLIAQTARTLARSLLLLKKGKYQRAAKVLGVKPGRYAGDYAKKWLEWRYGWMPLLSDIYGAAEHLSRLNPWDWKVTASKKARYNLSREAIVGDGFTKSEIRSKGWAGVHVRMDFIPTDLQELGALGITNPVDIAYELIPYSFVLDWLVPVGDWVKGLDHNLLISSGTACVSKFVDQTWTARGISHDSEDGAYYTSYRNDWFAEKEYKSLVRTVGPMLPPAFPQARNPFKNWIRMVTGLALLRNAFATPATPYKRR